MNSEACRKTSQRGVSAGSMLSQREIQTIVCREAQNEEDMFVKVQRGNNNVSFTAPWMMDGAFCVLLLCWNLHHMLLGLSKY